MIPSRRRACRHPGTSRSGRRSPLTTRSRLTLQLMMVMVMTLATDVMGVMGVMPGSGGARLCGAETPVAGGTAAADPSTLTLAAAVAQCTLIQERLTSALAASHPAAEIASLRQTLFDDENQVLNLRYTPLMKTLLKATFANDLAGFQAVCTKGMSDFMTAPILGSSHGYLIAAVPDQLYTLRYSGSYHSSGATCLFYVMRPAASGNDLTFLLTVDDDKCSGLEMH